MRWGSRRFSIIYIFFPPPTIDCQTSRRLPRRSGQQPGRKKSNRTTPVRIQHGFAPDKICMFGSSRRSGRQSGRKSHNRTTPVRYHTVSHSTKSACLHAHHELVSPPNLTNRNRGQNQARTNVISVLIGLMMWRSRIWHGNIVPESQILSGIFEGLNLRVQNYFFNVWVTYDCTGTVAHGIMSSRYI